VNIEGEKFTAEQFWDKNLEQLRKNPKPKIFSQQPQASFSLLTEVGRTPLSLKPNQRLPASCGLSPLPSFPFPLAVNQKTLTAAPLLKKKPEKPLALGLLIFGFFSFQSGAPSLSSHLLQPPLSPPDPTKAPQTSGRTPLTEPKSSFLFFPDLLHPTARQAIHSSPHTETKPPHSPPQTQILHPTATQRRSPLHSAYSSSGQNNSHNSAAITGDSVAYGPRLFPHRRPQQRTSHDSLSPCSSAVFLQQQTQPPWQPTGVGDHQRRRPTAGLATGTRRKEQLTEKKKEDRS
jgi:hypothetical protein